MINKIDIYNFKSIKGKSFKLRNLNVLLGLNGQGKSSFIQTLLMLRQSGGSIINGGDLVLNGNQIHIGTSKDAIYQFAGKNENLSINLAFSSDDEIKLIFDYMPGSDVFTQSIINAILRTYIDADGSIKTDSISFRNESIFNKKFQYLNANRVNPESIHRKNYTSVISDSNIGSTGEYTVDYIDTKGDEEIHFDNCIHPKTITSTNKEGGKIIDKRLKNQVNLWMGEISPSINIRTTNVSSDLVKLEFEFEQPTYGKTMPFKPENVGFGISYALHVVVALLKAKKDDLIIIENPESHIHPRGQAELGKLIALVAQNQVQIIIETHSDHLVNGIRVAVKEQSVLSDRIVLFYFEKKITVSEQYSEITDIFIDKNGELSNYPDNLLDEWSNQLLKLL